MRFLLVDRITDWKASQHMEGVKNIAMSEDFFEFHFPSSPVMPGVLLLEALAQLAGWLEAASSEFASWIVMRKVAQCRFYSFALPGDRVEMRVEQISSVEPGTKGYRGICKTDGRKRMTAEFQGEVMPLEELANVQEQQNFFRILTREATTGFA